MDHSNATNKGAIVVSTSRRPAGGPTGCTGRPCGQSIMATEGRLCRPGSGGLRATTVTWPSKTRLAARREQAVQKIVAPQGDAARAANQSPLV